LILAGPGIPNGMIHDGLVGNVDIVPTILELVDLPLPQLADGRSLVEDFATLAAGGKAAGREVVFANTTLFTSARSASGHKLIAPWDKEGPDRPSFFALNDDPDERNPLALEGELAERLEAAIKAIRRAGLEARAGEALIDELTAQRMKELGY
jgi:arylsulfatase A-like enzyme